MNINRIRRDQNLHNFDRYHDTLSSSFQRKARSFLKNIFRKF